TRASRATGRTTFVVSREGRAEPRSGEPERKADRGGRHERKPAPRAFAPNAFAELPCLRFTEDRGWRAANPYRPRIRHLKTPCWRLTSPNSPIPGGFALKMKIASAMLLPIHRSRRAVMGVSFPLPMAW